MSYQAVQWALDDAPMLQTPKGKPDTTARAVLVARAERAGDDGSDTHAAIADIMWRTGYDERTVQRAQERLELAGLMVRDGTTSWGTPRWNLDMTKMRDKAEKADIEAAIERRKEADRERIRSRRSAARATAEQARLDSASRRRDGKSRHLDSASRCLDAVPPEPPVNHPETSPEPPTGGAPPPDPRRPESPSGPRTENNSLSQDQDQHQDQESNHRPHAREKNAKPTREPCPHGNSPRTRRDGQPRCPECRTPAAPPEPAAETTPAASRSLTLTGSAIPEDDLRIADPVGSGKSAIADPVGTETLTPTGSAITHGSVHNYDHPPRQDHRAELAAATAPPTAPTAPGTTSPATANSTTPRTTMPDLDEAAIYGAIDFKHDFGRKGKR